MLFHEDEDLLGRESGLLQLRSVVASKTTGGAQESTFNWREWRGGFGDHALRGRRRLAHRLLPPPQVWSREATAVQFHLPSLSGGTSVPSQVGYPRDFKDVGPGGILQRPS